MVKPSSRVAGALLIAFGVIVGIALTAHFRLTPVAGSVEQQRERLPLAPNAAGPTQDFSAVARAVMPAVVNISTTRVVEGGRQTSPLLEDPFFRRFFGEEFFRRFEAPRRENSLGSGVIVTTDGYIVTNNHVVAKADTIKVLLSDKREYDAKVVGTDPPTDIAVLKIDAKNLPVIPWGNSTELQVGEYVLAVGNPFALNSTVTMGIVSAVGRANLGIVDYEDFIQTDAAINPGNSGGALVNTRGQLIGINTAIFSQSGGYMGVGFAVPSNMARAAMDSLIKTGKVVRGWLGVSVQEITQALAKQFNLEQRDGALINEVIPNSPAARAGLQAGDAIVSFAGEPVDGPADLRNRVAQTPIGSTVKMEVIRKGKREALDVTIVEQPKEAGRRGAQTPDTGGAENTALAGLQISDLTAEIARQLGVPETLKGVVVVQVAPTSPAAAAGVQPGDIILEVNRQRVQSVADFRRIASRLSKQESALLLINRRGAQLFLVLNPTTGEKR